MMIEKKSSQYSCEENVIVYCIPGLRFMNDKSFGLHLLFMEFFVFNSQMILKISEW
jgi:hypothetical protein